jgi:1,2-dihydroxy-3-keto-5-methylthiopentene dioxygenase
MTSFDKKFEHRFQLFFLFFFLFTNVFVFYFIVSRAYYIDPSGDGDVDVPMSEAVALGVLHWKLNVNDYESDLNAIKTERGYNYQDTVESTKIPDFEKKVAIFAHEHMHDDEEIRFCLDGSGFFDVRDQRNGADKWLRIVFQAGDMIVLPAGETAPAVTGSPLTYSPPSYAGIYHRFVVDEKGFFKVLRLFCGDPVWTPHNRDAAGTDERPARTKYVEAVLQKKSNDEQSANVE